MQTILINDDVEKRSVVLIVLDKKSLVQMKDHIPFLAEMDEAVRYPQRISFLVAYENYEGAEAKAFGDDVEGYAFWLSRGMSDQERSVVQQFLGARSEEG